MTQRYTIDTNCISDLEQNRTGADHLRRMLADHENTKIEIAVVAISASENQRGGKPAWTYEAFEGKLNDRVKPFRANSSNGLF